jgi:hypothetical protein
LLVSEVEEEEDAVVVVVVVVVPMIPSGTATPASDVNNPKCNSCFFQVGDLVLIAETVRHAQLG